MRQPLLGFAVTSLCKSSRALIHGTCTCTQLHSDTGHTFIAHSAASGREIGLESLLRARVKTLSAVEADGEGGAAEEGDDGGGEGHAS
jgi:hypothetical protein